MASKSSNNLRRPAAAILREMIETPGKLVICPGVYDGFTARIALDVGFDALYMTGAGTSASRLGSPDLGLITLTEMHANAAMIASLDPSIPTIADADVGFGSALSVARTVTSYIQADVAALHIEDQTLMKRCGHLRNKEIASKEEFVTRIRAASMARKQSGRDIVLIARTDALQGLGFAEAIDRLKAAADVGADVAFLEGILTEDQARDVCKSLAPTPCLLNIVAGGVTPIWTAEQAVDMGFKIAIWPILSLTAVFNSTRSAMKELREKGFVEPAADGSGGIRDVFGVCGINEFVKFDREAGGTGLKTGV